MAEQLVIHQTASFPQVEFDAFITKLDAFLFQIPVAAAVFNSEVKHAAKMGDKKEADATAKLEALKRFNSFLPTQLPLLTMLDKLNAYKQSNDVEDKITEIIDKMWANGILAGIDLIAMLTVVDSIAASSAALGNEDAIKYLNELEKIKATKKVTEPKPPKNPPPSKPE
jgi:hypothetical protein